MATYYFTLSSLPWLGGPSLPLTKERFFELCATETTEEDRSVLEAALDGAECEDPFVAAYRDWDQTLRYELAKLRAQKWGWGAPDAQMPEHFLADAARVAFQKDNPLEAEDYIDSLRLTVIDAMAQEYSFQWQNLVAYALKLSVLIRKASRDMEAGREKFEWNYQKITHSRGAQTP